MTVRSGIAAALVAGLAALAGCTGGSPPSGALGSPPTPGSITETVPGVTPPAARQYGLTDTAEVAGITIRIDAVTAVQSDSTIPGEKTGPALAFALTLRNGTSADYRTALLETSLTDSAGNAAGRLTGTSQAVAPPTTLAPGAEAKATFVYLIATDKRQPVTFGVSVAGGEQPAEFKGNA